MRYKKIKSAAFLFLCIIILVIPLASNGCSPAAQADPVIKVSGASDLYYLSLAIDNDVKTDASVPSVQMTPSTSSIEELKKGKCDAVLLGREPTSVELQGLQDYVIAYDATCIIIDDNSYQGGTYSIGGQREEKSSGLRDITSDELTQLLATKPGQPWAWDGDNYVANPELDPSSWLASNDAIYWVRTPASISFDFYFPPGKFDTQSILYQNLGLDEKSLLAPRKGNYLDPTLNMEEEVLSLEYKDTALYTTTYGVQNFVYQLGFASRRVMTIAPQHIPVDVVSVDGINPLTDTQSIYDGTYKFSRKIHLLVRDNSSPSVMKLVNYLQSTAGQKLITDVGYLPLKSQ